MVICLPSGSCLCMCMDEEKHRGGNKLPPEEPKKLASMRAEIILIKSAAAVRGGAGAEIANENGQSRRQPSADVVWLRVGMKLLWSMDTSLLHSFMDNSLVQLIAGQRLWHEI